METGIYNDKKPPILLPFNKCLYNNIKEKDQYKHKTPLGSGMLLWANNRITLQPASSELNYEKLQTTIAIIKTEMRNYNMIIMSLHVPNRLTLQKRKHEYSQF